MLVFNMNIIALVFDIAFLYQGKEEFGKLVLRNFVVKSLSVASIFIFVKARNDLGIYALIGAAIYFVILLILRDKLIINTIQ